MVDVLLTSLQSYQNSTQREHKEQCYVRREQRHQLIKALLSYVDEQVVGPLAAIRTITADSQLSDAEKIERIWRLLEPQAHPQHEAAAAVAAWKTELVTELREADYYRLLEAKSVRLQDRVSLILKVLTFQGEFAVRALLSAIQGFKDKDGNPDRSAPLDFRKPAKREAVTDDGQRFRVSLYKMLLFLALQSALKAGR